jgi:ABC-type microcin C transport system duplicated ATPase subunit YejF
VGGGSGFDAASSRQKRLIMIAVLFQPYLLFADFGATLNCFIITSRIIFISKSINVERLMSFFIVNFSEGSAFEYIDCD